VALKKFEEAGNRRGVAAAQDALGDLYALHGQHTTAFDLWRDAQQTFRREGDTQNANAVLAKAGEQHLLSGDATQARAAFAAMTVARPRSARGEDGRETSAKESGDDKEESGSAAGAITPTLAALGSCALLPGLNFAGNNRASEPPNEGSAPRTPNGKGRMDLRVTDEAGNPLEGAVAQLQSARAGGLYCECWSTTGALGRALLPKLPIADTVRLVLRAKDFPPQELSVSAQELARPVRVVVSRAGASLLRDASLLIAGRVAGAAACLSSYRAFNAYAAGELGLARADFSTGRLPEARTRYEALLTQLSLPNLDTFKQTARFRAAALTALGDITFREERFEEAAALYAQAAAGARRDNRLDLTWAAQRGLGRARWEQSVRATDAGQAARLRDDAADAYRSALRAVETVRAGSLRADEARTSLLSTTKDIYDEAAAVYTRMALAAGPPARVPTDTRGAAVAEATPLRGRALELAATAFAISEQGRARSLLDMLGESQMGITEGVSAELLMRRDEAAARQQEIAQQLTGVSLANEGAPAAVAQLEAELDRLGVELDGLENTIRTSSPRYAALTGARPLGLREAQQRVLDDGTALLLYNLGADESFLWLITPETVAIARLPPRAAIEAQALELRAQLIPAKLRRSIVGIDVAGEETRGLTLAAEDARVSVQASGAAGYTAAAHALYRTLLQPVARELAGRRLVVIPDGALNYVPFEALVTSDALTSSAAADYTSLPYLVRTNEVVYAPSASVIDAVRRQAAGAREERKRGAQGGGDGVGPVLVIADPVFSPSDARVKRSPSPGSGEGIGEPTPSLTLLSSLGDVTGARTAAAGELEIRRLASTRAEANDIGQIARAAHASADIWLDLDASESNLKGRDVSRYGVIHFATHGLLNAERPQFTGLVLSLVGERESDGFLRVGEVFNFRLGSPLVMLSACETGLGRERRGEGVIGLTRAFMYAGAPTVGVSLWAVADQSTAILMADFYRNFYAGRGARPGAAMRAAQLNMITNPRYSAPYYWAPFVLIGDWL
jgi:CHAT domain-containing protein